MKGGSSTITLSVFLIKWLHVWGIVFIHQMEGSCHQDGSPLPPLSKFSVLLTTVRSIKVAFVFAFHCLSDHLTPLFKSPSCNDFVLLSRFDLRRGWSPLTTASLGSSAPAHIVWPRSFLPVACIPSVPLPTYPLDCFLSFLFPLTSSTYPSISPEVLASGKHSHPAKILPCFIVFTDKL